MLRIDRLGNRVVVMTVVLVALAGLLVSAGSYLHTRSLAGEYDKALQAELQQKGLAYGQTAQGVLSAVSSSSPAALEALVAEAASNPQGLISQFSAGAESQNTPLGFEVWRQDARSPGGYQLLARHAVPGGRDSAEEDPAIPLLISQTAATGQPAASANEFDEDINYTFLVRLGGQPGLIVAVTLDASQEFAFIHAQRNGALRDAILFSIAGVVFVSVVGGGLSFLVSRTLINRKRAEEALRASELRYRTLAELSPVGIFRSDPEGENVYANERACEIMGITPEEALGEGWAKNLHPDDKERIFLESQEARASGVPFQSEYRFVQPDGTPVWVYGQTAAEPNAHGETVGYVGTVTDITEQKRMEEALREQTRRDWLTGVLNHAAIVEELKRLIAADGARRSCAVAMVDVDGLKIINDTYGHQVGDAVLLAVAQVLARDGALVGRYGGDEFVAVLPGAGRGAVQRYRREVTDELDRATLTDPETGAQVPLAATIGFAVYPEEADTIVELIKLADSAMYAQRRRRPALPGELAPAGRLASNRAAEMVGEIVPLLTSQGDLDEKLRMVAHRLSVGAGYDAVDFSLFAPTPGQPLAQSTFAPGPGELREAWNREQRDDSPEPHPIRLLFERAPRPVILDDPWNDAPLLEGQRAILKAAGLRSVLVAPMIWQGQVIGSLGVASRQEAAFTPRDAQFLTTVATQVTAIVRMSSLVEELQTRSAQLTNAQEETVLLLAAAAEAHDATTGQHLQHMQVLVEALARELGQSQEEARALGTAAALHDIGKLFVPDSLLASTGPLDKRAGN